ncbi:MAG: hypothetical protein JXB88_18090 [Spirochaetales bacterium]|nr:hypothetical protein [Spirochaetales bacterium]
MNKLSYIIILLLFVFTSILYSDEVIQLDKATTVMTESIYKKVLDLAGGKKQALAIYPFTEEEKVTKLGEYISSEIASLLVKFQDEQVKVLTRDKIDALLSEHQFQVSDLADAEKRVEIGKKLSAQYVVCGTLFNLGEYFRLNYQFIALETGEILSADTYSVAIDDAMRALMSSSDSIVIKDEAAVEVFKPEYVFFDTFDELNKKLWVSFSKSDEISVLAEDGVLKFKGKYREGRLNSINSMTSVPFKVKSVAAEIAFKDVLGTADTIRLTLGNETWYSGSHLQITANFEKEFYRFYWAKGTNWQVHDDKLIDELFGNEQEVFHRLRIVYDLDAKIAYGYVDDILVDTVTDFSFNRSDKLHISVSMSETVYNIKKDVYVEFDNFKCSLPLLKK